GAFPGGPSPARVVVKVPDVASPAMTAATASFRTHALSTGLMHDPIVVTPHPEAGLLVVDVPLAGNGSDATSVRALAALRGEVLPATFGDVPGAETHVGGQLAFSEDFNA